MLDEHRRCCEELESGIPLSARDRRHGARGALIALVRLVRRLASRVIARRRDERARRELSRLSERALSDIGLTRADLSRMHFSSLAGVEPWRSASAAAANQNEAARDAAA